MSFLGWVISLAANPVTDVREAVHALYDAIRRMWQITVDTLHIAIGALGRLANSATYRRWVTRYLRAPRACSRGQCMNYALG